MKSNQERSNGCLPPKKREILALEQRPVAVATATPPVGVVTDSPHTENLAWLASVATERCKSRDAEIPRYPTSSTTASIPSTSIPSSATPLSSVPLAPLPAVYPTAVPQQTGTIQFAQLGPNVQFISSGPYAGYISSHIISTNASSVPNSSALGQHNLDGYTAALISPNTKGDQQFQIGLSPTELAPVSLPSSPQVTSQYIHLDSRASLTVSGNPVTSPTTHLHLHPHTAVLPQTLTLAPSQLVLQYADGSTGKKQEEHAKAALNGEVEIVKQTKTLSQPANHQQVQSYEARHILLPADYGQNHAGLQTSLVLVAQHNHGAEHEAGSNKISLLQTEKGGICMGKPVSRPSSFTSLPSSEVVKSITPHTVIQTTLPSEELPGSLYSSTQPPIIGYITSANQHSLSYHATLPQHLIIPSGQSLLIPVSGTNNCTEIEISAAMPNAYLATALSKSPVHLADGELKRVEDLKTEDFIQSAEISNELKIDSSTVERIDSGQSPNAVVIQFSVGELKAQVCVEVLVEYPFFVFGQGWSSCCPDRTTELFELSCAKLCVGDVCVSLTLRGLRNGSVTESQPLGTKLKSGHLLDIPAVAVARTGEVRQESAKTDGPALTKIQCVDPGRPAVRKRRWSAPERDQNERSEEEPPLTLPKPSFIPQEVKNSIEGHSNAGSERCLNK
uniref:AXH domain-containing protein n=1 Tax=Mola mola TaxID=94237 RepID=A0A3Q3VR81_MOLML